MIGGTEWGKKSVTYERLWDIADVLEVPVTALLLPPDSSVKKRRTEAADGIWAVTRKL